MASPMDYIVKAPEAGVDVLNLQFAVGATGAVGAIQGVSGSRMKEFRRISTANPSPAVRTGAGVYDIFLREPWLAFIDGWGHCIGAISSTSGIFGKVTTNAATTPGTPKVTITFVRIDTGVAADPANGDIAVITLLLKKFKPA